MKRLFLTLLVTSFLHTSLHSQHWLRDYAGEKKANNQTENFYDIQEKFNKYHQDSISRKKAGYKQFKRWEWFVEQRVYPSGDLSQLKLPSQISKPLKDYNLDWQYFGPDQIPLYINTPDRISGMGRINCVEFHPFDVNTFWVGAPSGGVWRTNDNGQFFYPLSDDLYSIGISDIVVHPYQPDTLFILTGDRDGPNTYSIGIFMSHNGGVSWQETAFKQDIADGNTLNKLLLDPRDPSRQYAATSKSIILTTDYWDSYTVLISGDNFIDMEFHPGNPDIIYAATYSATGSSQIFRSTDRGQTFNQAMNGVNRPEGDFFGRIELAVSPAEPDMLYALVSDGTTDAYYGLLYSSDAGSNWTWANKYDTNGKNYLGRSITGDDSFGQAWYDLALEVNPENAGEVWIGGIYNWQSFDYGNTFRYASTEEPFMFTTAPMHVDTHELRYHPQSKQLFACHDGGLSILSTNTAQQALWKTKSMNDLGILQVYKMDVSQNNGDLIIAGSQDNGTSIGNSETWNKIWGGDGMQCMIDPDNDQVMYYSLQNGFLFKSVDGGNTTAIIKPEQMVQNNIEGAWITPFEMNPQNSQELLVGYYQLMKSTDGGKTWDYLGERTDQAGNIQQIAYAPSDPKVILFSTWNSLFLTNNGGRSWSQINPNVDYYISDILVSKVDPQHIWITYSGYQENSKIYQTRDGGKTWTNYSTGLPNLPVNTVVQDHSGISALYAGTDNGVYYRDAAMDSWVNVGQDLPNVIVTDLDIQQEDKKLYAATFGRGIWKTNLIDNADKVHADFTVEIDEICTGFETKFVNKGSLDYDSLHWVFTNGDEVFESRLDIPSVAFEKPGNPSTSLTVYKGGNSAVKTISDLFRVTDSIELEITLVNEYPCDDSAQIIGETPGIYNWTYNEGLGTVNAFNMITAYPQETTTYQLEFIQGSCRYKDSVTVKRVPNNDICDAIPVSIGSVGTYANICVSTYGGPVPPLDGCNTQTGWCEGEGADNSVWFTFEADASGTISIITRGFDTQLALYDASNCVNLNKGIYNVIAANDDYHLNDNSARIEMLSGLRPGKTYWIQVDGSYGGVSGIFTLEIDSKLSLGTAEIELSANGKLKVFPNPNHGSFNIEIPVELNTGKIEILSTDGKRIYQSELNNMIAGEKQQIQVDWLEPGQYIIMLSADEGVFSESLIIE